MCGLLSDLWPNLKQTNKQTKNCYSFIKNIIRLLNKEIQLKLYKPNKYKYKFKHVKNIDHIILRTGVTEREKKGESYAIQWWWA